MRPVEANGTSDSLPQHAEVAIVGAGFSGLGMAIRLKQAGRDDFVVLERGHDVGGTWRDNTYPGCQCDVPSILYSFSFALNPRWSRTFSHQHEIQDYLRRCAHELGVLPHVRFGHELADASWDEARRVWRIRTSRGEMTAGALICAVGAFSTPHTPEIPGLDGFDGKAFHTARWDHDHDLRGERVAVIGTGASSIQVVPQVQPIAERLYLFQRTPAWIMPHRDRPTTRFERLLYRASPRVQRLVRAVIYWSRETFALAFMHPELIRRTGEQIARRHLRAQVRDPQLRRKLTPSYRMGCKRILLSNDYYPALTKPNAELVTDAIVEIRGRRIVTADGAEREVDTIVFGTGFHVTDMPVLDLFHGRDGRSLGETWANGMEALAGTTVAGFPNFFFLLGPNTGLGHNSVIFMAESQMDYVMDALETMRARGIETVEPRREAVAAYNDEIQSRMTGTVWSSGGCASWYLDAQGRNTTLWPGFTWRFRQRTRRFDVESYATRVRAPQGEPVAVDA